MDVNTNYAKMAKKVGRPTSEPEAYQTHQLQTRVSAEFLAKLDTWRRDQPDLPTRTEAIRRLTALGLEAEAKKRKAK